MADYNAGNVLSKAEADVAGQDEYTTNAAALISNRFEKFITLTEMLIDWIAVVAAIFSGYGVYGYFHRGGVDYALSSIVIVAVMIATLNIILLDRDGAYSSGYSMLRIKETERTLRVSIQTLLLALPVVYFFHSQPSRLILSFSLVCVPILQICEKQALIVMLDALHTRGRGLKRVVIYGAGQSGQRVFSALARSPKLGLNPVALVDDNPALEGEQVFADSYRHEHSIFISTGSITKARLQQDKCSLLIVALPNIQQNQLFHLVEVAQEAGIRLAFVPNQSSESGLWTEYANIDGTMFNLVGQPTKNWRYDFSKRVFDLFASLGLILVLLPISLAICLMVKLDSHGPIFFKQQRVGRDGKIFWLYKFRSMHVDAPKYTFSPTDSRDTRITRAGRFLRKTSMDELPQLINVAKGEMSLVGPRPEMPFIVAKYNAQQRLRLSVLPGLTGLWQLSADRAFLIHENIQYDLYYIRNRSLFMDVAILLHTAFFAMNGV